LTLHEEHHNLYPSQNKNDKIKEDEIGSVCSTNGGTEMRISFRGHTGEKRQLGNHIQEPPLHKTSQQPHGTTRPQTTETSAHRSAHQISCVNVVLDVVLVM
jgi:hypothetical protein